MAPNEKQVEAWNGGESVHYVDHAHRYDRQLLPFTEELLKRIRTNPQRSLLDVGCGCGALTLAAARIADSAVGLDISVPLTDVASERAGAAGIDNVEFVVADAQTYHFIPGVRLGSQPVRTHVLRRSDSGILERATLACS